METTTHNAEFFVWGPFLPPSNPLSMSNNRKKLAALPNAMPVVSSTIDLREGTVFCLETVSSIFNLSSINYLPHQQNVYLAR